MRKYGNTSVQKLALFRLTWVPRPMHFQTTKNHLFCNFCLYFLKLREALQKFNQFPFGNVFWLLRWYFFLNPPQKHRRLAGSKARREHEREDTEFTSKHSIPKNPSIHTEITVARSSASFSYYSDLNVIEAPPLNVIGFELAIGLHQFVSFAPFWRSFWQIKQLILCLVKRWPNKLLYFREYYLFLSSSTFSYWASSSR